MMMKNENDDDGDVAMCDNDDDDGVDQHRQDKNASTTKTSSVVVMETKTRNYIQRHYLRGSSLFSSSTISFHDSDEHEDDGIDSHSSESSRRSVGSSSGSCSSREQLPLQDMLDVELHGINICGTLGTGSFGIVHEITVSIASPSASSQQISVDRYSIFESDDVSMSKIDSADAMQLSTDTHVADDSLSTLRSYACKRIRPEAINDEHDELSCSIGIAYEAMMLSVLSHPNIVRMHGTVGHVGDRQSFGIVLDKLERTLREEVIRWSLGGPIPAAIRNTTAALSTGGRSRLYKAFFPNHSCRRNPSKVSTLSRLNALYDVAKGMEYIHKRSIIFRDLKLDNVGLNSQTGNFCLLDFNLSRELKQSDLVGCSSSGMFALTGMIGTMPYCAPEVLNCEPYGLSADVYSFSMLSWEVMALRRIPATAHTRIDILFQKVVKEKLRPPSLKFLPKSLRRMMKLCWADTPSDRPQFRYICDQLHDILLDFQLPKATTKDMISTPSCP